MHKGDPRVKQKIAPNAIAIIGVACKTKEIVVRQTEDHSQRNCQNGCCLKQLTGLQTQCGHDLVTTNIVNDQC